jgi:lipopolysaccharide/colanic/teichoic acid biosynthesis glycosyltransferase
MPEVLAAADACLAILMNITMFRTTFPNKVFDYMAAGRPTVLAIDGVIRRVIEEAEGGIYVPPGDAGALAAAIGHLAGRRGAARPHGRSARRYVVAHFDRREQAEAFLQLARQLADRAGRPAGPPRRPRRRRGGPGGTSRPVRSRHEPSTKRLFDVAAALAGLVVCAPLMAVVALAILVVMGRPVLFRQVRPGFRARPVHLDKFRTMSEALGPDGRPLPDARRLTRLGPVLRATSLDELPQLCNVLKGGPEPRRPPPLLMEYLPRYSPQQARRHEVRPGITGWAQVKRAQRDRVGRAVPARRLVRGPLVARVGPQDPGPDAREGRAA